MLKRKLSESSYANSLKTGNFYTPLIIETIKNFKAYFCSFSAKKFEYFNKNVTFFAATKKTSNTRTFWHKIVAQKIYSQRFQRSLLPVILSTFGLNGCAFFGLNCCTLFGLKLLRTFWPKIGAQKISSQRF